MSQDNEECIRRKYALHRPSAQGPADLLAHPRDPQLCASGCSLALPPLQLALARNEPLNSSDMTTTTLLTHARVRSFDPPDTPTSLYSTPDGRRQLGGVRAGLKRRNSRTNMKDREDGGTPDGSISHTWLRRMSSTMSRSRDSSRASNSRPGSSSLSPSNGSVAFSATGSATHMLPDNTPPSLPPNKLIKRSASLRSNTSSPVHASGTRLPLPVFRRPATSHERSATLQEKLTTSHSQREGAPNHHDVQWRHYWTPKQASDGLPLGRRRHSTGIPNPIKRVYPDRKHTPMLVSAHERIRKADLEMDDSVSEDSESAPPVRFRTMMRAATPSVTGQAGRVESLTVNKRPFSISDVLSAGPQQTPRKQSGSKRNALNNKSARNPGRRTASAPLATMGGVFSSKVADGSEPPAKRRDFSDPRTSQRSIYSSSSSTHPTELHQTRDDDHGLESEATSPHPSPWQESFHETTPSLERRMPSATSITSQTRQSRLSNARSEDHSTVGSEGERRSIGDASTDYQSDTVWDSFPTRTTRSSSGRRGPPIDTIFDDSPPTFSSGRSTKLKDLLSDGSQMDSAQRLRLRHSTIEEEGSIVSTPPRTSHEHRLSSSPSVRAGAQQLFQSSPPVMPDPDDMDWDAPDDSEIAGPDTTTADAHPSLETTNGFSDKMLPFRLSPFARSQNSSSATSTPRRNGAGLSERATIFDWSEQQASPAHVQHSPPRPKTVHGKKEPDNRGSRSAGRRPPSGMHARSHSVPVVPVVEGKRNNIVANKFGTWGVGSKAVTEDWNEDFDFDDDPVAVQHGAGQNDDKRIDSGHEMFVPKSIREQQENVVANIILLREWGLLIEELKELRIRASALNMLHGEYAQAWSEVDAMIELADQESEEHTLEPRQSPPSSPGFDYDAFEEQTPNRANTGKPRRPSNRLSDPAALSGKPRKALTFDANTSNVQDFTATRPRKDSEAVARSVIEALQAKRSLPESTDLRHTSTSKVPFDTATLRHIVPYVNTLKRKVKDALRETEGLHTSPQRRSSPDTMPAAATSGNTTPSFHNIFNEPRAQSPITFTQPRTRKERAASKTDDSDSSSSSQQDDLAKHMDAMSIVSNTDQPPAAE